MNATLTKSERLAWSQRGYDAGRYSRPKMPPADNPERTEYLRGYRIGTRERLRAEAGN